MESRVHFVHNLIAHYQNFVKVHFAPIPIIIIKAGLTFARVMTAELL